MNIDIHFSLPQTTPIMPLQYFDGISACFECASASWISADALINEIEANDYRETIAICLKTAESTARLASSFLKMIHNETQDINEELLDCWENCRLCAEENKKLSGLYEHSLICMLCCDQVCKLCERYLRE